jgi:hypothetical protein
VLVGLTITTGTILLATRANLLSTPVQICAALYYTISAAALVCLALNQSMVDCLPEHLQEFVTKLTICFLFVWTIMTTIGIIIEGINSHPNPIGE